MADDKDIVARLLAVPAVAFEYAGQIGIEDPSLAHEAAARIQSDAATIAALREALGEAEAVLLSATDGRGYRALKTRIRQALRSDA